MAALTAFLATLDFGEILMFLLEHVDEIAGVWDLMGSLTTFTEGPDGHPLPNDVGRIIAHNVKPNVAFDGPDAARKRLMQGYMQGSMTRKVLGKAQQEAKFLPGTLFAASGIEEIDGLVAQLAKHFFRPPNPSPQAIARMQKDFPDMQITAENAGMLLQFYAKAGDEHQSGIEEGMQNLDHNGMREILDSVRGLIVGGGKADTNRSLLTYLRNIDIDKFMGGILESMQQQIMATSQIYKDYMNVKDGRTYFEIIDALDTYGSGAKHSNLARLMAALGDTIDVIRDQIIYELGQSGADLTDEHLEELLKQYLTPENVGHVNPEIYDKEKGLLPNGAPPEDPDDEDKDDPMDTDPNNPATGSDPNNPATGSDPNNPTPAPDPNAPAPAAPEPTDSFSKYVNNNLAQKGVNRQLNWYWTNRSTMANSGEVLNQIAEHGASTEAGQAKIKAGHSYNLADDVVEKEEDDFK